MHSDIQILKEKAERLEAIISTGEGVNDKELEALAEEVGFDSMSASSSGPDAEAMLAAMKDLIKERIEEKAK
eukprot:1454871-Karenia_brevis.AAC.1